MTFMIRALRNGMAVLALGFSAFGAPALAGDQDFTVINQTGVEIHRLYTSPHNTDDWEEDVLGEDTLPDGESLEITFSPRERAAMWDLRIEDADGNSIDWERLNLLEISTVTLHYDGKKAWADVE